MRGVISVDQMSVDQMSFGQMVSTKSKKLKELLGSDMLLWQLLMIFGAKNNSETSKDKFFVPSKFVSSISSCLVKKKAFKAKAGFVTELRMALSFRPKKWSLK